LSKFVPAWLGGRRAAILGAVAVAGGGMALGWPWLVAIGAAPLLLSLLPCAIMCGLGLCMMGKGKSGASQGPTTGAVDTAAPALLGTDAQPVPSAQMASARAPETVS
jgi:hypothetical protein